MKITTLFIVAVAIVSGGFTLVDHAVPVARTANRFLGTIGRHIILFISAAKTALISPKLILPGEILPMIGGPRDGELAGEKPDDVECHFEPCWCWHVKGYWLDIENQCWLHETIVDPGRMFGGHPIKNKLAKNTEETP